MSAFGLFLTARLIARRLFAAADAVTQQVLIMTRSAPSTELGAGPSDESHKPDRRKRAATDCVSYWLTLHPIVTVEKRSIANLDLCRRVGILILDAAVVVKEHSIVAAKGGC